MINTRLMRMVSSEGFEEIFWEDVQAEREKGLSTPLSRIFDRMNEEYFAYFGKYRYSSYTSFRIVRDRKK